MYLAGARHTEIVYLKEFPASMLGLLGLRVTAVLFPMAGGVNAYGVIGGAAMAMAGAVIMRRTGRSGPILLAAAGMIVGLVTLVWTDARLSLAFSVLTVGLIALTGDHRAPALRWVVIIPILFPLVLLGCLSAIPATAWEAIGGAARELASLSNREGIWHAVFAELLAFKPVHLVGFGAYGQQASGISQAYSNYFSAYMYPEVASAHNAFLQAVVETGYLGVAVTMAVMAVALGRLVGSGGLGLSRAGTTALVGLLVFSALVGCVEASWSPEHQELQVALLLALCGAGVSDLWGRDGSLAEQVTRSAGDR